MAIKKKRRLTTFSKLLLTVLIVGSIVCIGYYFLHYTSIGQDLLQQSQEYQQPAATE